LFLSLALGQLLFHSPECLLSVKTITAPEPIFDRQLKIKSKTIHFCEGSIIADSHQEATGLMVITSGLANVELPMDSTDADEENRRVGNGNGRTLLYVFGRGYAAVNAVTFGRFCWCRKLVHLISSKGLPM
jgi:hypothetical protein